MLVAPCLRSAVNETFLLPCGPLRNRYLTTCPELLSGSVSEPNLTSHTSETGFAPVSMASVSSFADVSSMQANSVAPVVGVQLAVISDDGLAICTTLDPQLNRPRQPQNLHRVPGCWRHSKRPTNL